MIICNHELAPHTKNEAAAHLFPNSTT